MYVELDVADQFPLFDVVHQYSVSALATLTLQAIKTAVNAA
ncbi:MAG: hypothetical protein ABFC54_01600 [Thermoguttaceae bacterium]